MSKVSTAVHRSARADFFVLRVPLLALDTLRRWAEGVSAPAACAEDDERLEQALAADRALLRRRLALIVTEDQIADGLELASPDLADGVARWREDPATKRARSAERSLVRYITRIASRADLFGLAGAYVVGSFAEDARLELDSRSGLRVRAQLDSGLLQQLVRRAGREAIGNNALEVRRNRAVYRAGGRLRVAARQFGSTKHRLVAVRPTPAIELALQTASEHVSVGALVSAIEAAGLAADHAPETVRRLIASDLLVPVAEISVTGLEPSAQAVAALRSLPNGEVYAEATERAISVLSSATRMGRATVEAVARELDSAGINVKRRRCIRVDASRPGEARLPPRTLTEMRRTIDLLARITPPESPVLESFKQRFERRFATRSIPLLEALDPDFGIRLAPGHAPGDEGKDAHRTRRRRALLGLIERGRSAPSAAVELTDGDVAALSGEHPAVLSGAFAMITSLVARSASAVRAGEFQLVEPLINGPSGARLLGRLCHADPELGAHVREHLRREAARSPDVVFAELSLAPETEAGLNITHRPLLREWEIEYGGASGGQPDRRLEPSDLMVSVEDDEVVLRSVKLGRRVVPSSTTALNPAWVSLPAGRFLLSLAHQRVTSDLGWSWDELRDTPALPRVTRGRTILSLRRWTVPAAELADLRPGTDAAGYRRLQEWRRNRGLPRLVGFEHPKSRLLVDFENVLSLDAFLAGTNHVDPVRLVEALDSEPSPVQGPDGHYAHQLVVPFTLAPVAVSARRRQGTPTVLSESRRRFPPGTEWLYVNLYGPVATADRVLVEHVGPLARRLRQSGLVDRWFFIRYADPESHLRVRFHGRPGVLLAEVLPALHEATAPAVAEGLLYRISLDTYEREIERYGGLEGVELMEQAAEVDSESAMDVLRHPPGAVERRHLAVASLAGLYADAGLLMEARHACCSRLRSAGARDNSRSLGALLGAQERSERAQLACTVEALARDDAEPRITALRKRSAALAPILERLRALADEGILEQPFDHVVCSLAHMSVNRMLKRSGDRDELRVHDALARLYETHMARERSRVRSNSNALRAR